MIKPVPHKKVEFWDDERSIGNSLIVTLVLGWKFAEDSMAFEHTLGFDTKADAMKAVRASVPCNCKDCLTTAPAPVEAHPENSAEPTHALSIKQPWAWLITNGFKDVENRTWRTKFRGVFFVHAGKGFDSAGYAWVKENMPDITMPAPSEFKLGGIVGSARLDSCVEPGSRASNVCPSKWYFDHYGFVLSQAVALDFVPLKGKLSFFRVDLTPIPAS